MWKPLLNALALLVLLCAPCAAAPADEEVGEVPFTFEKGFVIVAGKIKGKEAVEFVVSTGATNSTVDAGARDRHKLKLFYTGVGIFTGFSDKTVSFATVPDVRVGPASAASINARIGSTDVVSKVVGREIFGTLGYDFLKGRAVQFDFAKRVMRFLDGGAAEALRAKAAGAGEEAAVLRMGEGTDMFEEPLPTPLVEGITFDGKHARVMLSTGVATAITLTPSTAKKLGFEPPPQMSAPRRASVAELRIGPMKFSGVPVRINPEGSLILDERQSPSGALAGTALLQNFVATFDFRGRTVVLERL
jgi:predicted aspartyl protease